MKPSKRTATAAALVVLILAAPVPVHSATDTDYPAVTAPPDSFFARVTERHADAAREFYKKHVDIKGLPVVAAAEVADLALHRTYDMVTHMLAGLNTN